MAKQAEPKDPKKPLKNLRWERFALAYIRNEGNGTRAYMDAYPRASYDAARSESARLLANPSIVERITHLRSEAFKREHMGAEEVLKLAAVRARSDIGDLFWKPGELDSAGNPISPDRVGTRKMIHELPEAIRKCIRSIEIEQRPGRVHPVTKISLLDPTPHETNIMKHHKLIGGDVNINIQVGFSERLRAARERRLKGAK